MVKQRLLPHLKQKFNQDFLTSQIQIKARTISLGDGCYLVGLKPLEIIEVTLYVVSLLFHAMISDTEKN